MREKNGMMERGRGKWQRGSAGAYSLPWNASRRVSQVCWPAATAARAGRRVLYSMVADVRYDDDRTKKERRRKNKRRRRSLFRKLLVLPPFLGGSAPQSRRRFKDKLRNQTSSPFAFQVINSSLVQTGSQSESQGIPPPLAPTHPDLLKRTCAREQSPTCPHRLLCHHTHVTRTWALRGSLPLRHRSAGAGACTRTPGRRGRPPWR